MLIKGKNGKAPASKRQPKSASSSPKSVRSNSVPKNPVSCDNGKAADELDGDIVCTQGGALEGATDDRVLETPGISEDTSGEDLSTESAELTAITLHQPWASLIAAGKKHYETRSWGTDYRGLIAIHAAKKLHEDQSLISFLDLQHNQIPLGAVVAIAELTDCILMDEEFILKQSSFEQYLGLWEVGRYAWKLENVRPIAPIPATGKQGLWKWEHRQDWQKKFFGIDDSIKYLDESHSWNPGDFGELQHKAEADGQLNFLEWVEIEPPEPGDYESREQFEEDYRNWVAAQPDENLANFKEVETWNQLMDGSICAAESAPASPMPESNCGADSPTNFVKKTAIVETFSSSDIPQTAESLQMSTTSQEQEKQNSSQLPLPANLSALMESDLQPTTIETVSQQSLQQSENSNQNLQLSKTSEDCSTAPIPPATNQEAILVTCSTAYTRSGSMRNGKLSAAPTLAAPGVGKESLLLRSPGGLSSIGETRPPGKNRLETQLNQLELIQDGEVAAPEFLEAGFDLPTGWTNPQEKRTAIKLAQVQAQQLQSDHKSESPAVTETTAIEGKPWAMPSIGEWLPSDSSELSISVSLPPNIGALTKTELLSLAQEQHQIISLIERKQFELALERLHRVYVTGICLMEFKKKCRYGEFVEQLEACGIGIRSAQNYMTVSKNWEVIEAKAQLVALLPENNERPTLGIKWALEVVRDEKKQLKSAAPPKDPDGWRTPNTSDQPIVSLVKKSLGGQIWLDPCSDSSSSIPASMRYYKQDDGLARHNTWSKTLFINPPFSDPFPWVERCCFEFARGNVTAAIMLLKAGTISNVGTGELINKYASAICHWRGRINFLNDEGNPIKGSDFDCVLIYFGARLDLFRQNFGGRGTIATIENHYSSVNKKFLLKSEIPEFGNTQAEQKQLATAVGLGNGRSVLPDMRDADRERMERYDPHTVVDVFSSSMPTAPAKPVPVSENLVEPLAEPEIFDQTPLAVRQFETAKQNTLNDYITAISSNLADFSDEQIAFLAKIINEESAKRIGF